MVIEKKCRTLASVGVTFRYGPWHPSVDKTAVMDRYGEQVARACSKEDSEAIARAPEMAKALIEAADEVEQLRAENARLREAVRIYANQSIGPDWTPEQALGFIKQHARAVLASDARTEGGA